MQFLLSVIDDRTGSATGDEMAAIDAFNDRLRAEGHWVLAGGLTAPDSATVVDGRGASPVLADGPFVESTEFIAGFWVVDCPDDAAARELATEASRACNRRVELRPFLRG